LSINYDLILGHRSFSREYCSGPFGKKVFSGTICAMQRKDFSEKQHEWIGRAIKQTDFDVLTRFLVLKTETWLFSD